MNRFILFTCLLLVSTVTIIVSSVEGGVLSQICIQALINHLNRHTLGKTLKST